MPEKEEVENVEAKLKAAKAELKRVEAEVATARETHERLRVDAAAAADLRSKVNGYAQRLVKFHDLGAIEDALANLEKRLADVEKKGASK